jgi:hypothetical protein
MVKRTAGQGIEALRARFNSSSTLTVPNGEALRDILTTLRAPSYSPRAQIETEAVSKIETKIETGFKEWLQAQGKTKATVKEIVNYAKLYSSVLDLGDASGLVALSPRNRHHAMTALANLSKYQGRYDRWLDIRRRHNLKWSNPDSMAVFERFFNPDMSLEC